MLDKEPVDEHTSKKNRLGCVMIGSYYLNVAFHETNRGNVALRQCLFIYSSPSLSLSVRPWYPRP